MSKDGMYALIKCDNNSDNSKAASVASVLYWERACAEEPFVDMMKRVPKYVTAYLKGDDAKGEAIAWSLDGKSFTTASDATGSSNMNLYTRASVPVVPASCSISATPIKVTKPTLITNTFTYNSQSKTVKLNPENDALYSITSGGSASAIGKYNAKVTLKDKTNYQWTDGSTADLTLSWSITSTGGDEEPPLVTPSSPSGAPASGSDWINDDFEDFNNGNYNSLNMQPNNICVKSTNSSATNVEAAEDGSCPENEGYSKVLRLHNGNSKASFTVPNAKNITIELGAKVSEKNQMDVKVTTAIAGGATSSQTKQDLWQEECATYSNDINSPNPVTVTVETATSSETFLILAIKVTKYNPTVTVSTNSLTGLGYKEGDASIVKSFDISGTQLASGGIRVTPPDNYEISKNGTSNWSSSELIYLPSSNTVANGTKVYVRLKKSLSVDNYAGEIEVATLYKKKGSACDAVTDETYKQYVALSGNVTCAARTISFGNLNELPANVSINHKEPITIVATPSIGDGSVTYNSSNEDIAEIDNNGIITIKKIGNVTFSATVEASGNYCEATTTQNYSLQIEQLIEYLLDEGKTASFNEEKWKKRNVGENGAWEENQSIDINSESVMKITVNGKAVTDNQLYKTRRLEIGATGYLDVIAGEITIPDSLVIVSEEYTAGQLEVHEDATLIGNYIPIVKKAFYNARWYHVAFPFDVEEIIDAAGIVHPISGGTGKGVHAKMFDMQHRADLNTNDATSSSPSWKTLPQMGNTNSKLERNMGYQLGENLAVAGAWTTLFFVADKEHFEEAYIVCEKEIEIAKTPTSSNGPGGKPHQVHTGWNLVGNPYTTNYHFEHFEDLSVQDVADPQRPRQTYVFDHHPDSWDYEETPCHVVPFRAFFFQVGEDEDDQFTFTTDGCQKYHNDNAANAKMKATAFSDEIKLGLTKDNSFTDWYRVRFINNDLVSEGFDFNIDAMKMLSSKVPQLYHTASSISYAVDVMPHPEAGKTLPLTYRIPVAGTYTISNVASPVNFSQLLLIDNTNNTITDLLLTPSYEFNADAGTVSNRFELVFELMGEGSGQTTGVINTSADNDIILIASEKQLILRGLSSQSKVIVIDLAGRQVAEYTDVDNNQALPFDYSGIFIAKIENPLQTADIKIILK